MYAPSGESCYHEAHIYQGEPFLFLLLQHHIHKTFWGNLPFIYLCFDTENHTAISVDEILAKTASPSFYCHRKPLK